MRTLLGLILFSVLLATGASLKCDTCKAIGDSCTGTTEWCGYGEHACVTVWLQIKSEGILVDTIIKSCIAKYVCADLKSGLQKVIQQIEGVDAVIKKAECSKALVEAYSVAYSVASSGSLLLALSGFLLLKLLS